MPEKLDIIVENKLIKEKRDINVYHQSTRSAHIISRSSSITLPLKTVEEDDYLYISIVRGPGNLWKDCVINIPSWADFEFSLEGKAAITHTGNRTLLKIPPGPPTWQLKMTRPKDFGMAQTSDHVIIGDKDKEPGEKE
ncbi:MAG: hypothetical protein JSV88_21120 [Candidatus Aminicenantes bacterium]|nr:MAG: hypothetical protein JSV88_21120 [Candidatus Aminicenantes bacterium]